MGGDCARHCVQMSNSCYPATHAVTDCVPPNTMLTPGPITSPPFTPSPTLSLRHPLGLHTLSLTTLSPGHPAVSISLQPSKKSYKPPDATTCFPWDYKATPSLVYKSRHEHTLKRLSNIQVLSSLSCLATVDAFRLHSSLSIAPHMLGILISRCNSSYPYYTPDSTLPHHVLCLHIFPLPTFSPGHNADSE